jgi:hypothetical protein
MTRQQTPFIPQNGYFLETPRSINVAEVLVADTVLGCTYKPRANAQRGLGMRGTPAR